eukprot:gene3975-biopygen12866
MKGMGENAAPQAPPGRKMQALQRRRRCNQQERANAPRYVLFCSVMFYSVLLCTALFCSVLSCPVLSCPALLCSVLLYQNKPNQHKIAPQHHTTAPRWVPENAKRRRRRRRKCNKAPEATGENKKWRRRRRAK